MVCRRGLPQDVISDNGSNFIGADRELRELVNAMSKEKIQDATAYQGVKWTFNPPQCTPLQRGARDIDKGGEESNAGSSGVQ